MRCHYLIFNTIFQKQLTALHWRRYAMYQQIVVKRGNLILLIVNPQDNTGLCHYVISVRKTSVIGSTKRELKVMKLFKYKFSSAWRDTIYYNFVGISIRSTQFLTYLQNKNADSSIWELKFGTIVPYSSKNFLHIQAESEYLRTKINTRQRVAQN